MRIKDNKNYGKIIKLIKLIILMAILVATYFVSDKFIEYVITIDKETLKRVVNIILAVITILFYTRKD